MNEKQKTKSKDSSSESTRTSKLQTPPILDTFMRDKYEAVVREVENIKASLRKTVRLDC